MHQIQGIFHIWPNTHEMPPQSISDCNLWLCNWSFHRSCLIFNTTCWLRIMLFAKMFLKFENSDMCFRKQALTVAFVSRLTETEMRHITRTSWPCANSLGTPTVRSQLWALDRECQQLRDQGKSSTLHPARQENWQVLHFYLTWLINSLLPKMIRYFSK